VKKIHPLNLSLNQDCQINFDRFDHPIRFVIDFAHFLHHDLPLVEVIFYCLHSVIINSFFIPSYVNFIKNNERKASK